MPLTARQLQIITQTVLGEAAGEGPQGQAAVANVIRNRSLSGQYPADPAAVAQQHRNDTYQFSTWADQGRGGNNPQRYQPGQPIYDHAEEIVRNVFNGTVADPTGGSLFYHTRNVHPGWADDVVGPEGTIRIGNHVFYPQHPVEPVQVTPPVPALPPTNLADIRAAAIPVPADIPTDLDALRAGPPPMPAPASARPQSPLGAITDAIGLPSLPSNTELAYASSGPIATMPANVPPIPREPYGMSRPGNIDLLNRPVVQNPGQERLYADAAPPSPNLTSPMPPVADISFSPAVDWPTGQNNRPIGLADMAPPDYSGGFGSLLSSASLSPSQLNPQPPTGTQQSDAGSSPFAAMSLPYASEQLANGAVDQPLQDALNRKVQSAGMPSDSPPLPASMSLPLSSSRAAYAAADPALMSVMADKQTLNYSIGLPSTPTPKLSTPSVAALTFNAPAVTPPAMDTFGAMPDWSELRAFTVPGPNAAPKSQERLTASAAGLDFDPTLPSGGSYPGAVDLPGAMPTLADLQAFNAPPAMPTVPKIAAPQVAPAPQLQAAVPVAPPPIAAPVPAARLDRPTSFFPGMKLPGLLGGIQDFSKAMNNASGPFNNGFDNLLASAFNGGNHYAPGAATATAGGYMFAPTSDGGWQNVGPVDTSLTPEQRYDVANGRAPRPSNWGSTSDSGFSDSITKGTFW